MTPEESKSLALAIKADIEHYDHIVICRHERPDCDAHGAALGLKAILKANYPTKDIRYFAKEAVDFAAFLGPEDPEDPNFYKEALCIVVDTATQERVSSDYFLESLKVIKIDHHPATDNFGALNYVDVTMPACCAILCRLVKLWGYTLPQEAMKPLYVGMVMDTGRFKYVGTNGEVMTLAGELIDQGHLDLESIYADIGLTDISKVHFSGYVSNHFKQTKHGVNYIVFTKELREKFNASLDDCSSLVNNMDSVIGSQIWMIFIETETEVRISMRSRYISLVALANKYNGGGHKNACGARIPSKDDIKKVLKDADEMLKEFHTQHPECK